MEGQARQDQTDAQAQPSNNQAQPDLQAQNGQITYSVNTLITAIVASMLPGIAQLSTVRTTNYIRPEEHCCRNFDPMPQHTLTP